MAQTVYRRPWPAWAPAVVSVAMAAIIIVAAVEYGFLDYKLWTVVAVAVVFMALVSVLDPEVTVESKGVLPDGTPVKIRRPLVGFKRLEEQVGINGNYEVRIDGYRYARAYIRL